MDGVLAFRRKAACVSCSVLVVTPKNVQATQRRVWEPEAPLHARNGD